MNDQLILLIVGGIMTILTTGWGSLEIRAYLKRRREQAKKKEEELETLRARVQSLEKNFAAMKGALEIAVKVIDDDSVLNEIKEIFDGLTY